MGNRSKLFVAVALVVLLVSSVPLSVMMSDAESPSNEVYCSDFAYSKLTGNDKMAYENLDKGLKKFESTGNCDPITMYADEAAVDLRKLCGVFEAYRSDHPEKFWASYYDQTTTTEDENHYVGVCISDKEKARIAKEPALKDKISELNTKIDNIAKSNSKDSLYDRVKYLHDKVINLTKYESDEDKCMDCGNAY